jgi:hypothetical protein
MKLMRRLLVVSLALSLLSGPLFGERLSEKFKERPTKDTFLDKNKDGINDYFEKKEVGRSFLKGILEGINKGKYKKVQKEIKKPKLIKKGKKRSKRKFH